jgi:plastocyanin
MPRTQTTRRPRSLTTVAALAVVVGALALGACGGDSGDAGTDGSAAAARATTSTSSSSSSDDATGDGPQVSIEDFAFSPDPLRVKVGTKVTFTNEDGFDHTVTAKDKSFDSGHLAKDATFDHTFDAPGTYPYLCNIHNSMTGSVVVS